jgi:hypothetical protein
MKQTVQERQDALFRKMSAEAKIRLWSDYYELARQLQRIGKTHAKPKTPRRSRPRS